MCNICLCIVVLTIIASKLLILILMPIIQFIFVGNSVFPSSPYLKLIFIPGLKSLAEEVLLYSWKLCANPVYPLQWNACPGSFKSK